MNGSFLQNIIERTRAYGDDVVAEGKYDDAFLMSHVIPPAMTDVMARLSLDRDNPILIRYSLPVVLNQRHYTLPPCIGMVMRFVLKDSTTGDILSDWRPEGLFAPAGPGWYLEGNQLVLDPMPQVAEADMELHYIPSGDFEPHYATNGTIATVSSVSTLTLSSSPTLGSVDRREGSYLGQILRLIPSAGRIEEHVVNTHVLDSGDWKVTTRRPVAMTDSAGDVRYELVQMGMQPLADAIAAMAALKLATYMKRTQAHREAIKEHYKISMKTVGDNLAYMQARTGKYFDKRTTDNDPSEDGLYGLMF